MLRRRAHLMDGTVAESGNQSAVGAYQSGNIALGVIKLVAGFEQSAFDDRAERNPRLSFLGGITEAGVVFHAQNFFYARCRAFYIFGVAFNADKIAADFFGDSAGGAGAEKRIQNRVADIA